MVEFQKTLNDSEISNRFVNHFSSVADKIDSGISSRNNNDISKYLLNRQINTFYLSQITPLEIEDTIVHLKDNGCGLYNFSTDLLINVKSDISTTLA